MLFKTCMTSFLLCNILAQNKEYNKETFIKKVKTVEINIISSFIILL